MQGLQQSYTQYFNRKHHKVGHLFQGRYKAILCEKDEYLLTLVRYIHSNPIRAKLVQKPDDYAYSGHGQYCGRRVGEVLVDQRFLGEERFVEKLKVQAAEEAETPHPNRPFESAFRIAVRALGMEPSVLAGPDRGWAVSQHRALVGYVLIRRMGYKLNEVAKCLGRDTATVSSLISRYSDRMTMDQQLKKRVSRMVKDCLEHKV